MPPSSHRISLASLGLGSIPTSCPAGFEHFDASQSARGAGTKHQSSPRAGQSAEQSFETGRKQVQSTSLPIYRSQRSQPMQSYRSSQSSSLRSTVPEPPLPTSSPYLPPYPPKTPSSPVSVSMAVSESGSPGSFVARSLVDLVSSPSSPRPLSSPLACSGPPLPLAAPHSPAVPSRNRKDSRAAPANGLFETISFLPRLLSTPLISSGPPSRRLLLPTKPLSRSDHSSSSRCIPWTPFDFLRLCSTSSLLPFQRHPPSPTQHGSPSLHTVLLRLASPSYRAPVPKLPTFVTDRPHELTSERPTDRPRSSFPSRHVKSRPPICGCSLSLTTVPSHFAVSLLPLFTPLASTSCLLEQPFLGTHSTRAHSRPRPSSPFAPHFLFLFKTHLTPRSHVPQRDTPLYCNPPYRIDCDTFLPFQLSSSVTFGGPIQPFLQTSGRCRETTSTDHPDSCICDSVVKGSSAC